VSEKERSAMELEQKLESEKQAVQSAKAMLEDKISEAQTSKSELQELRHQVWQSGVICSNNQISFSLEREKIAF
jgi:hypothetical protein